MASKDLIALAERNVAVKRITILLTVLALSACEKPREYPQYEESQAVRRELFQACLKAVPAGSRTAHYNDWSEVIEACGEEARRQSLYCYANCPPRALAQMEEGRGR